MKSTNILNRRSVTFRLLSVTEHPNMVCLDQLILNATTALKYKIFKHFQVLNDFRICKFLNSHKACLILKPDENKLLILCTYACRLSSHTHLTPGPGFPLSWAGHSVTRPAALGAVSHTVLAVHRAVGAVMEGLKAAHGAKLVAGTPTGFGAMLPLFCYPAVGVEVKRTWSRGCRMCTFLPCKPSLSCSPSRAHGPMTCNPARPTVIEEALSVKGMH